MIVDSSALIAILYGKPQEARFLEILIHADVCRMSAASFVEACVIADARARSTDLDRLLRELAVRIEPVTESQARLAREAYQQYGRGNHPAKLNFFGLFRLCASEGAARTAIVQRHRFCPDRCAGGGIR